MKLLIAALCFALQTAAPKAAKQEQLTVNITVKQVLVSDRKAPIDRRLKSLAAQLKKAKIKFASLKLLSTRTVSVPLKKEQQLSLANDMVLKLLPLELTRNHTQLTLKATFYRKVKVKTSKGKVKEVLKFLNTLSWRLAKGQHVIVGGYNVKEDKLIIHISADWKKKPAPPPPTPSPKQ